MKAKLRLKYAERFRNTYTFEEDQLVETKIDDKEYKTDEEEENNYELYL